MRTFVSRKYVYTIILMAMGLVLITSYQNCSDMRLMKKENFASASPGGKICTRKPNSLEQLHRVLFFIDNSQSLQGIDPGTPSASRRVTGLRRLIDEFRSDDNFTIAMGAIHNGMAGFLPSPDTTIPPTFNATCAFLKPRATSEYTKLQDGLTQMDQLAATPIGNTSYGSFISNAKSCIESDMQTNTSGTYSVVLVTDGGPTDLGPTEFQDKIKQLIAVGKKNPHDPNEASRVNIFLYFMEDLNQNPDAAVLIYKAILAAHDAGGYRSKYVVKDDGGPIDYKAAGIFNRPKYKLFQFVATNMNAAITVAGVQNTDSDSDGVDDAEETKIGLNPEAHSPHRNCSDLIYKNNGRSCLSSCVEGQQWLDSDFDGLSDCDELNVGSSPYSFDSDGDSVYDGIEVRIGSNPIAPDETKDFDNDGFSNAKEAQRQTGVYKDDRHIRHRFISDVAIHQIEDEGDERCYRISVKAVQLFPTKEVRVETISDFRHYAGANNIKFMFFQIPDDMPGVKPTLLYSTKKLYYEDYEGGVLYDYSDFSDSDFTLYEPETD